MKLIMNASSIIIGAIIRKNDGSASSSDCKNGLSHRITAMHTSRNGKLDSGKQDVSISFQTVHSHMKRDQINVLTAASFITAIQLPLP
jgi:hypothetical protein